MALKENINDWLYWRVVKHYKSLIKAHSEEESSLEERRDIIEMISACGDTDILETWIKDEIEAYVENDLEGDTSGWINFKYIILDSINYKQIQTRLLDWYKEDVCRQCLAIQDTVKCCQIKE
jgi:hypothetical protein